VKYLEEFREAPLVRKLAEAIRKATTRPWTIMEICGGQTHAIMRFGLDQLLPPEITLVHGPGCPVCVTPIDKVDKAVALAERPEVILCSFGDMLRVPGSSGDLLQAKARGGDVRMVYSPLDAVVLAKKHPEREVVFFAIGFETTAPANAMAAYQAKKQGLTNFTLLVSQVLVPPAMDTLLSAPDNRVQGFLAAGHVCTITGFEAYHELSRKHRCPMIITGFEPVDILQGLFTCVRQLERGEAKVENAYARAVSEAGNTAARAMLGEVFTVIDREWRGIGWIPQSGYGLAPAYRDFDAEKRFTLEVEAGEPQSECISGLILQGIRKPHECPAFGTRCTPESPLGATMVSEEGACAAYHKYRQYA
jgi:hydrogenase expression/formation protein HypD